MSRLFGKDDKRGGPASPAPAPGGEPLHFPQDRALIRLELLRLAHRHDVAAQNIVERAQAFEVYVFDDQAADKP